MSTETPQTTSGMLVEAEAFDEFGGWVLDSQFENQMGLPHLLAHGLGKPVADAKTVIAIPDTGCPGSMPPRRTARNSHRGCGFPLPEIQHGTPARL